ncbi:MAG: zinc-binding dehydrogenase [Verrucomicrobiota bacterium]
MTTKAYAIREFGGPDRFEETEIDLPGLKPTDVRLSVRAASVNPIDYKLRRGDFGGLFPLVLGHDMSGVVEEVGSAVSRLTPGDEIWAYLGGPCSNGSYAEEVVVPEAFVAPKPSNLSWAEAAAFPVVGLTSLESLRDRARIAADDTVFVAGGAGGLGSISIQLLRQEGVESIVTTAGSDASFRFLREELGLAAKRIVDYRDRSAEEVAFEAMERNGDASFSVALDYVGGPMKEACFKVIDFGGRIVSVVEEPPDFAVPIWNGRQSPLFAKSASLHFELLGARGLFGGPRAWDGYFHDLITLAADFESKKLRPLGIADVQPMTVAAITAFHERLESGGASGKLVLEIH